jgi:hypothetical protein
VLDAQDYAPFGMVMPGRKFSANIVYGGANAPQRYRYGFNGQERDTDVGENINTAMFWEYDARIGRRWNVDPVVKPWESPYACFSGNPIALSDINGDNAGDDADKKVAALKEKYKGKQDLNIYWENDNDGNIRIRGSYSDGENGVTVINGGTIERTWAGRQLNKGAQFVTGVAEGVSETVMFAVNVLNPDPDHNSLVQLSKFAYNLVTDPVGTIDNIVEAVKAVDFGSPRTWGKIVGTVVGAKGLNSFTKAAKLSMLSPYERAMAEFTSLAKTSGAPAAVATAEAVAPDAPAVAEAAGTAAKGGSRLVGFGSDAAIVENTASLVPKRGWYDVVVHGTEDGLGFTMNGSRLSPQQLYNNMLANGYQQGTKIRLMSCYSGSLPNGAAYQLSKFANASVVAPTNSMWIANGQGFLPFGRLMVDNGGWFNFFK